MTRRDGRKAAVLGMVCVLLGAIAGCSTGADRPAGSRPDRILHEDVGPPIDAEGLINDLPCDIAVTLVHYCIRCHGTTPARDARTMLSAADFQAFSTSDPTRTTGAVAVERLRLTTRERMPPIPSVPVPDSEIAAFESWVGRGMPTGSCAVTDPFDVPPQCTSMRMWTLGNWESPLMRPGGTCIACHVAENEGPRFTLAGTVYPTAHEPDDCNGAASTATSTNVRVEVFDAAGHTFTMMPNAVGNFGSFGAVTFPITARITSSNGMYEMTTEAMSGDCNSCHTQEGTHAPGGMDDAPGRIVIP